MNRTPKPTHAAPFAGIVLFAILFVARLAAAHAVGLSRGEYHVTDRGVRALYVFSRSELAASADAKSVVEATTVRVDGSLCRPHFESVSEAEGDAVSVRAFFACDRPAGMLSIDCGFLDALAEGHRHLATVSTDASESVYVLDRARERIDVDLGAPPPPKSIPFGAMVWTGVEHIGTGYDHLAFLFGVVLLGGRPRSLVGVVSAFTLAHSITLAMAVLGVVSVPPSVVEPAIALSIAYVGIEDVFGADPAKRWRITFPFGLVHGFGFASALTSLALPRAQVPAALLAFNLGVELGQLAVLAAVLPVVLWARRYEFFRVWGVRVLSFGLAVAGFVWFFRRIGAV